MEENHRDISFPCRLQAPRKSVKTFEWAVKRPEVYSLRNALIIFRYTKKGELSESNFLFSDNYASPAFIELTANKE